MSGLKSLLSESSLCNGNLSIISSFWPRPLFASAWPKHWAAIFSKRTELSFFVFKMALITGLVPAAFRPSSPLFIPYAHIELWFVILLSLGSCCSSSSSRWSTLSNKSFVFIIILLEAVFVMLIVFGADCWSLCSSCWGPRDMYPSRSISSMPLALGISCRWSWLWSAYAIVEGG